MTKIHLQYVRHGKCIDCTWPTSVYHYWQGDTRQVWRDGCRCLGDSPPPKDVQAELRQQEK